MSERVVRERSMLPASVTTPSSTGCLASWQPLPPRRTCHLRLVAAGRGLRVEQGGRSRVACDAHGRRAEAGARRLAPKYPRTSICGK
eukprot:4949808-Pleurochrysis_carterae.AAC.2